MMSLAQAASARHLWRHPGQLLLALVGLALGVASIVAIDIAVASSRRAFELSLDAVNGAATQRLTAGPAGIDERLYVQLRRLGITHAVPVVEGYVRVGDRALQLVGTDPLAAASDERVRLAITQVRDEASLARWLSEPGAALLSRRTANELGIGRDERFEIAVAGRRHAAVLVGYLAESASSLLVADIAQAQEWLGLLGRLSRIDLHAPLGSRVKLPGGVQVEDTERTSRQSLDLATAFTTNLQAMSLLALLVGVLLVYSAVSFTVIQRRPTLGILRALGVAPAALLATVLLEAALLGIAGAGLGVAVGAWIGRELLALVSRTINDLYFVVAVREVALPLSAMLKAFAAGVGVALVAAAVPALEVARSAPQLALRRSSLEQHTRRAVRGLAIASVACALAAATIVLLSERDLNAGFAALFLLLAAAAALTPAVLRTSALAATHIAGTRSPIAAVALGDVAASLSRTAVAVGALGVALAAMIGVAVMVGSFRESLREWLGRTLQADVYITAPGPGFARPERRLDPEVVSALLSTQGVVEHSASRRVSVATARGEVTLDALEFAPQSFAGIQLLGSHRGTREHRARTLRAFTAGELLVSESLAWRLRLEPGDALEFATPAGTRRLPIAAVYREYGTDRGTALISRDVYRRIWRDDAITSLGLYLAPQLAPQTAIERLRAAASRSAGTAAQALHMRSNAELRALSMRIFERTFAITRVLYWLAAGVAAIGLTSALSAWQLERARELSLLRALGVTPSGAARLIGTQTAFMSLIAWLAAIPTGLLTALMLIEVVNRRAFGWQIELHLRAAPFADSLLVAAAAAAAAALYPAWRASRVSLAGAMREE